MGVLHVEPLIENDLLTFVCHVERKRPLQVPVVYEVNISSIACKYDLNDYIIYISVLSVFSLSFLLPLLVSISFRCALDSSLFQVLRWSGWCLMLKWKARENMSPRSGKRGWWWEKGRAFSPFHFCVRTSQISRTRLPRSLEQAKSTALMLLYLQRIVKI